MKRALQITMVIVSAIPLALGIVNFYLGSGRIVPAQVGMPDPPMLVATVIEVGVLVFIPWHAAVIGRQNALPA